MKKSICVILAMLLVAMSVVPAFAAGGSHQVTFTPPSEEFEGAYHFVKSLNGDFVDFVEDPDGAYGQYSVDQCFYYIDNLTDESRKVFDEAEPGSLESKRFSPKDYENCEAEDGETITFCVYTSEAYDINTVTVLCNGEVVQKNAYGEYAVVADQDLIFSVKERDENNAPILLMNHFTVTLTSGEGYAAKPLRNTNNKVVYYGGEYEFRVKITKGYNGDNMKVKVIRGSNFLSEYIGEEADMLSSITGEAEVLSSTGVDVDGYRTYKIKNITTDCKVLISGVNKDSNSGVLAMLKRILRLILGMLGINLDSLIGEENNPLAAYTVTLNTSISAGGVTYTTNPEFKYNSETGNYEAEVLNGECVTIVVTKQSENQSVVVDWSNRDPESYNTSDVQWQAYYDFGTQRTTWSAVWYVDGISSNTTITITAN